MHTSTKHRVCHIAQILIYKNKAYNFVLVKYSCIMRHMKNVTEHVLYVANFCILVLIQAFDQIIMNPEWFQWALTYWNSVDTYLAISHLLIGTEQLV